MASVSLILEGGGMRGAFTAGVLDCWLQKGILIKTVYGVSAGACQACSYLSGQKGRGIRVWINHLNDKRFRSWQSLLRTGDLFNADFNYRQIPFEIDPIDEEAYLRNGCEFHAVVTDLATGQAEYPLVRSFRQDMRLIQATASLPLISRPVEINGKLYLDGGVADSIPLARSLADGHQKHVIVLTQAEGYQKRPNRAMPLIKLRYRAYPRFVQAVADRHILYNQTLRLIAREQAAGRAFVIRPAVPPDIGRIEKDPEKMRALYRAGYETAEGQLDALNAFLG